MAWQGNETNQVLRCTLYAEVLHRFRMTPSRAEDLFEFTAFPCICITLALIFYQIGTKTFYALLRQSIRKESMQNEAPFWRERIKAANKACGLTVCPSNLKPVFLHSLFPQFSSDGLW